MFRIFKKTKKEIINLVGKNSTAKELLNENLDLTLLLELSKSNNNFLNTNYKNLTTFAFQDVQDILEYHKENELMEILKLVTNKSEDEILNEKAGIFINFVKWINEQIEIIYKVYDRLNYVEELDKDDIIYKNSGSEKLDKYKEMLIYYSIDKNPLIWEQLKRVPFEVMITKLMIDKDMNSINKKFTEYKLKEK